MLKKVLFITLFFMLFTVQCYASNDIITTTDSSIDFVDSKTGINAFQNTIDKLKQLKGIDWKQSAPAFKLNLHDFNKSMKNEDIVFCDFKKLETIQFLGFTVIEYFRMLISCLLYFSTGMYVYRQLGRVLPQ